MKTLIAAGVLIWISITGDVLAACPGHRVARDAITATVQDKLMCAQKTGASDNNARWAQEHLAHGVLWEHAKGALDTIDPRHQEGTWSIGGARKNQGTIIYKYSGESNSNEWSLFKDHATYRYCTADGATEIATATLLPLPPADAPNPCGFPP